MAEFRTKWLRNTSFRMRSLDALADESAVTTGSSGRRLAGFPPWASEGGGESNSSEPLGYQSCRSRRLAELRGLYHAYQNGPRARERDHKRLSRGKWACESGFSLSLVSRDFLGPFQHQRGIEYLEYGYTRAARACATLGGLQVNFPARQRQKCLSV